MFRLGQPPQTLEELEEHSKLLETLQRNSAKTEAQIKLIQEEFAVLQKYDEAVENPLSDAVINALTFVFWCFYFEGFCCSFSSLPPFFSVKKNQKRKQSQMLETFNI